MSFRIVGFTGSLRKHSVNKSVLELAQRYVPEGAEMEIISLADLPMFNQDLEPNEPESVRHFKQAIREADAVVITTPEYNGSIPGVLKNALDWASRPAGQSAFIGKPVALLGAGGRAGTASAQQHLRFILQRQRADVLEKPEVYITNAWEKFDAEGNLIDEESHQPIRALMQELVRVLEENVVYEQVS